MLNHTFEGSSLLFAGILNNNNRVDTLTALLKEAWTKRGSQDFINVDFQKVQWADSMGLRNWIVAMRAAGFPVNYQRCPIWLCEQLSSIAQLIPPGGKVESVYAPFYNKEKDETITRLVKIADEIKADELASLKLVRTEDGAVYELDSDPEIYFMFLTEADRS